MASRKISKAINDKDVAIVQMMIDDLTAEAHKIKQWLDENDWSVDADNEEEQVESRKKRFEFHMSLLHNYHSILENLTRINGLVLFYEENSVAKKSTGRGGRGGSLAMNTDD